MDYLEITGPCTLSGSVRISGAKNAALPLIAMSILSSREITIKNMPEVADIKTLLQLLENLGANYVLNSHTLKIDTNLLNSTKATYDIVRTMRASILVLGPLLARFGHCEVSLPGGCAIGERPVDLHLRALEQMGAEIIIENGYINAKAPNGLRGANIIFDKITVTGTENIVMAATLAYGETKIINAAKEPEVVQLCEILQESGVKIRGIGTDELHIIGTDAKRINIKDVSVISDRIEAGTYLCAGAITNSKITLTNVMSEHLDAVIAKLEQMGFSFTKEDDTLTIHPAKAIKSVEINTTEYPGFPTDMQAQFMALASVANGVSIIEERLFENRFMHVSELKRMGAKLNLKHSIVTINGADKLLGADVMATDLRASSALVLAALVANGTTNIHRIYHLDRGYEKLEEKLSTLGANIKRFKTAK